MSTLAWGAIGVLLWMSRLPASYIVGDLIKRAHGNQEFR